MFIDSSLDLGRIWDVMNNDFILGLERGSIWGEQEVTAYSLRVRTCSWLFNGSSYSTLLFFFSRYASLYFCCAVENQDNELLTLEIVHRYVELLDKYFGNVSVLLVR